MCLFTWRCKGQERRKKSALRVIIGIYLWRAAHPEGRIGTPLTSLGQLKHSTFNKQKIVMVRWNTLLPACLKLESARQFDRPRAWWNKMTVFGVWVVVLLFACGVFGVVLCVWSLVGPAASTELAFFALQCARSKLFCTLPPLRFTWPTLNLVRRNLMNRVCIGMPGWRSLRCWCYVVSWVSLTVLYMEGWDHLSWRSWRSMPMIDLQSLILVVSLQPMLVRLKT